METHISDKDLRKRIDSYVDAESLDKARASLDKGKQIKFIKDYYSRTSLDYKEEKDRRFGKAKECLTAGLKDNADPPYSDEIINSTIEMSKMAVMDEVIGKTSGIHSNIREKLQGKDISHFKSTMVFQLSMGSLAMEYNQAILDQLDKYYKEFSLNSDKFMEKAFPQLTGDFSLFTEIDFFSGLSEYKKLKTKAVEQSNVIAYLKRMTEYSKMVVDGKLNMQTTMVFPTLSSHFLFNEFKLENIQVFGFIVDTINAGTLDSNIELQTRLLDLLYYFEKGRKMIENVFDNHKMMIGESIEKQNTGDDLEDSQVFPSLMQGVMGRRMSNRDLPFDPNLLSSNLTNFESNTMPNMEDMAKMMEDLDFDKLEEYLPEMEKMMKGVEGLEPKKN